LSKVNVKVDAKYWYVVSVMIFYRSDDPTSSVKALKEGVVCHQDRAQFHLVMLNNTTYMYM